MHKEWEVMVSDSFQTAESFVYLYREVSLEQIQVYHPSINGTEIQWGVTTYEPGEQMIPTFVIPRTLRAVMTEFVQKLCKHFNIVLDEVQAAQSAFESQGKHLEDLQKIIFGFDYVSLERGQPERVEVVQTPRRDDERELA